MMDPIIQPSTDPEAAATGRTRFLRLARIRWWLAPLWAAALYLSIHHAAKALIASAVLLSDSKLSSMLRAPEPSGLATQRLIQQHYLSYGVYIPLDDIVIYSQGQKQQPLTALLQQSCGEGLAYVWVPLRLQLPLVGEKVLEWCLVKA